MKYLSLIGCAIVLLSCNETESSSAETISSNTKNSSDSTLNVNSFVPGEPLDVEQLKNGVDLSMDISELSLSDLRILRNSFAARQGYCFMKADLRAVYNTTTWYNDLMDKRFWEEEEGDVADIKYSAKEEAFIKKVLEREKVLKTTNFYQENGRTMANLNNLVNKFQVEELKPELSDMLGQNGFAIVPNNNMQLFHVYEANDYSQFPNFVTTDMYMQLFHMYFGFILREVEEKQFIPLLKEITQSMITDMKYVISNSSDSSIKKIAAYNETYYAIANTILTGKQFDVPVAYQGDYSVELKNINGAADAFSSYLDYTKVTFPYSLYKPRGHYTRTSELKQYFKAMMWLQTAPFCLDNDDHLKRALLSASVLANSPTFKKETLKKYDKIMRPINFLIGEPDNVSFLNLAQLIDQKGYTVNELMLSPEILVEVRESIKVIADAQNKIKPKTEISCTDKINFIPQRYLSDNEVLQELVDVKSEKTKRGYPKGLDIMAAFGSLSAENILINELKEGEKWSDYPEKLSDLKSKMKSVDWNSTVYNKWIESLLNLQKTANNYPYFMQNNQWRKKDLNASLASWAELKHDAILYAEQPMGAECGGGGPPEPYTVGYVEPNIGYWNSVIELLDLTEQVLNENQLMNSNINRISTQMKENAQFLLTASKKELTGEKLNEAEYNQIEIIGSTFEWITLDIVKDEDEYISGWSDVKGPDKSIAVVADIYTANSSNNNDKGILHVAAGNVNDIYVIVEIEGYLYLTKGAVFGYHEFHIPLGNRLTDEEWQDMLEKNEAPPIPDWMKEIIVPIDVPKANERIFYSSGC